MIWGVVWIVCNLAVQFAPTFYWSWPIGVTLGTIGSIGIGATMAKPKDGFSSQRGSWRHFANWLLVMGFIVALFCVIAPIRSNREAHSIFGLVFGFLYVGFGLWTGWRLIALGAALVALTLFGFYGVGHWYPLYMGLVAGGALFLGGLWLRRI